MNALVVCPKCEKLNRVPLDRALAGARPVCGECKSDLPFHDGVQDLNASTLAKLIRVADRPVVVDFWASWCGPCKAFAPTFQRAARELADRFVFAKLDTEAQPSAAGAHGIRGIPTLIVFSRGAEVDRRSGAIPYPTFVEYLGRFTTQRTAPTSDHRGA